MKRHKQRVTLRKMLLPYLGMLLVLVAGVLGTEYVSQLATDRAHELREREALAELSQLRARLEGGINSVLYLTRGLTAFITVDPDAGQGELQVVASHIVRSSQHIRNIGLAPGNVIRFVYPLQGNEQALGLDYEKDPKQWPAIRRAIAHGDTVVAGPLKLVQGGIGLIARTPIFVDEGKDSRYWGMASVVIDMASLLRDAGVDEPALKGVAIRGVDGKGADGAQFFGPDDVFGAKGVLTQDVVFGQSRWQLGIVPNYRDVGPVLVRVQALCYGLLTLVLLLLALLIRMARRAEKQATRDPLTGLPNRRLFLERARQLVSLSNRSEMGFALCVVDLDGFKPVNDRFGHHAGDAVLKEVAQRMRKSLRGSDTIARTGGDEFVLLLPMASTDDEARRVADKVAAALEAPLSYREVRISVGASLGWALYPTDADSLEGLMDLADTRMYEAKAYRKQGHATPTEEWVI